MLLSRRELIEIGKREMEAEQIECVPFELRKFQRVVDRIRSFTVQLFQDVQGQMVQMCSEAGVVLVLVPQLPKTRVSGATRWLSSTKALIQLSLRYRTNDHFWFTFFHEAGHLLLGHSKREIYITEEDDSDLVQEQEANDFAADFLIPKADLKRFVASHRRISKAAIQDFADRLGIAPGIVVGRLQHDRYLPPSHCNGLKRKFSWAHKKEEV